MRLEETQRQSQIIRSPDLAQSRVWTASDRASNRSLCLESEPGLGRRAQTRPVVFGRARIDMRLDLTEIAGLRQFRS